MMIYSTSKNGVLNIVTETIKKELISRGKWVDFVRMREERLDHGEQEDSAAKAVLKEIAPDLVSENVHGKSRRGRKKRSVVVENKSEQDTETEQKSELPSELPPEDSSTHEIGKQHLHSRSGMLVGKHTFAGKSCSISTAFMWAYSNLCFSEVDPSEAPSAVAWQMYCDMKTSNSLKADMLKSGLGAAMRKSESEDAGVLRFDGEEEYDILKSIAEASAQ